MKKPYVIWDFDGTLACTNNIIIESWQATFRHFLGHELPLKEVEAVLGETLVHTISQKFPKEDPDEVADFYRAYQYSHNEGRVYVFDGVRELLEELKAKGYRNGVATSRSSKSLIKYLEMLGLDGYMDVIISMEDVEKHKPDPESINRVLDKFGAAPEEAIMIGDTKYDIGCANNAGVDSVLIGWSHYVDMDSMAADGYVPTYVIEKPEELLKLI